MSKRMIVVLLVLAMTSGCTAMLVGGDVSSGNAADCDDGRGAEACKN